MNTLVTGATGQDGSYLLEHLLEQGHSVYAGIRHSSVVTTPRIEHLRNHPNLKLLDLDMQDSISIYNALRMSDPQQIFNLAAQSHVKVSYSIPEYTGNANALGTLRILDLIQNSSLKDQVKFYQASTSELFGPDSTAPQDENTALHPRSPYGISKLYAYWMARHHREAYGMFVSNGILFNHESPRRPHNFVTRKISSSVARIVLGKQSQIRLGDLNALRDWGHSRDYVKAMGLILNHKIPDDFVISSGTSHSVREFTTLAFEYAGINIAWEGEGIDEAGLDKSTGKKLVVIDPLYFRPGKEAILRGDSTKARNLLGWSPETSFEELVKEMVENDMRIESSDA